MRSLSHDNRKMGRYAPAAAAKAAKAEAAAATAAANDGNAVDSSYTREPARYDKCFVEYVVTGERRSSWLNWHCSAHAATDF
jgi:hypothetical protein